MLTNQKIFDLKSKITDDWGSTYRVSLDLNALYEAEDWRIGLSLPNDYKIDQIYNAELSQEGGQTYISGADWNKNLDKGSHAEVILIVDEGNSSNSAPILPQLVFADSVDNSVVEASQKLDSAINFDSKIVEDWNGGYKLELDLKAESNANNWQVYFSFPYDIRAVYGVELIDRGNGNYTISGQPNQANLQQGQSIKPIFIVDDNGQSAIAPKSISSGSETKTVTPAEEITVEPAANDKTILPDTSNSEAVTPVEEITVEPVANDKTILPDTSNSEAVTPIEEVTVELVANDNNSNVAQPDGDGQIIDVDNDFGSNLEQAIAAASNGDVVLLGANTYYTSGIKIEKDITIDGREGSIIDGGGTSDAILYLTSAASGATIQDVEITNGNNGIAGNGASDLILQNLNIHNIGITETIRDGQNNTGINLDHAEGLQLLNSQIHNIGRKGVSVGDTDGGTISGISVYDVNLAAQHTQSHDAAGIKFFNTNAIILKDSYFTGINANHIWNDTTNGTIIDNNLVEDAGKDFLAPSFNDNVSMSGIYHEKSSNGVIKNNTVTSVNDFPAFNATEFSVQTMILDNNDFSSAELGTTDYWVNEEVEKLIATTEDPDAANFSLFANEYFAQANIG